MHDFAVAGCLIDGVLCQRCRAVLIQVMLASTFRVGRRKIWLARLIWKSCPHFVQRAGRIKIIVGRHKPCVAAFDRVGRHQRTWQVAWLWLLLMPRQYCKCNWTRMLHCVTESRFSSNWKDDGANQWADVQQLKDSSCFSNRRWWALPVNRCFSQISGAVSLGN